VPTGYYVNSLCPTKCQRVTVHPLAISQQYILYYYTIHLKISLEKRKNSYVVIYTLICYILGTVVYHRVFSFLRHAPNIHIIKILLLNILTENHQT